MILLTEFDEVKDEDFVYTALPYTWFSGFGKELKKNIDYVYHDIIFPKVYSFLANRSINSLKEREFSADLKQDILEFLNSDFMNTNINDSLSTELLTGKTISFNNTILLDVITMLDNYEKFVSKNLSEYPADIQYNLKTIAKNQLDKNVQNQLSDAIEILNIKDDAVNDYESISRKISNFKEVDGNIIIIIKMLNENNLEKTTKDFSSVAVEHSYKILENVDDISKKKEQINYQEFSLNSWNGKENLMAKLFGTDDKEKIKHNLEKMRKEFKNLAINSGQHVIKFLNDDDIFVESKYKKLLTKWKYITEDMENYEESKKNSL